MKKIVLNNKSSFKALLAFVLPSFLLFICLFCKKMYPFGDTTIYTWDLSGQYSSFFVLLHNILIGKADWSYSLSGGLGDSLFGLIAYYLSSPFNIILAFFNANTMPIGVLLLLCLKLSCMSLFMYLYLNHKYTSFSAILFGVAYSFSSYSVAYQSNIMWMDALVFLPLVIWGLEKLIEEKKILLYSITLGITIISNYYTGYMVCLFCVIFFVLHLICKSKKATFSVQIYTLIRFAISSLCAGGLSAFLIFPALSELSASAERSHVPLNALTNGSRMYLQTRLLPLFMSCSFDASQRWDAHSLPLVYCGILAVIGLVAFFIAKQIPLKTKLFGALLIACIFISYNHMNLFFIWHGFYTPFGHPWRFAFIGVFSVLLIAYEGFFHFTHNNNSLHMSVTSCIMLLYFVFIFLRCPNYRGILLFNIVVATIFLFSNFIMHVKKNYTLPFFLCLCTLCVELSANTLFIWNQGFTFDSYANYLSHISQIETLKSNATTWGRSMTVHSGSRNINDGFLLSLNTPNLYTSTVKSTNQDVFHALGNHYDSAFLDYSHSSTALSNALISLRYLYGNNVEMQNYKIIASTDNDIHLYENENVLPLAFPVNASAVNNTITKYTDLFEQQNSLFHALVADSNSPYQNIGKLSLEADYPTDVISYISENLYTDGVSIYSENQILINDTIKKVSASTLSVDATHHSNITACISNDTNASYACFSIPYDKNWHATVNGQTVEPVSGMGNFLLVPINNGISEIEIVYRSNAFTIGCFISIISLISLVLTQKRSRKIS